MLGRGLRSPDTTCQLIRTKRMTSQFELKSLKFAYQIIHNSYAHSLIMNSAIKAPEMFIIHYIFRKRRRTNNMKPQIVLILLAFTSLLAAIAAQNYGEFYCGRRLARALALLCNDNLIKRTPQYIPSDFSWPWIGAHSAHSLGRRKRQVASECCDKRCTIDELLSYCGN